MRVVVVEDELLIAMMLEDELTDLGHRVTGVASTVEGALALLRSATVDFALVDLQLADGDCFDLIAELKTRHIPFALVTGARIDVEDGRFGHVDVLEKPVDLERLTEVLERSTKALEDHMTLGGRAPVPITLTMNAAKS
jgi:DNA-binding response OmpR family regulator